MQKITATLIVTVLCSISNETTAQTAVNASVSRQVMALKNSLVSWKQVVDDQFVVINNQVSTLQAGMRNCADRVMLYNGSRCVPIPTGNGSTSSNSQTKPQQSSNSESKCTASVEICNIYADVLGRDPDQAGAHFWQGEIDRLKQSGMTAKQAADQVRNHIEKSNENTTGAMSAKETENYLDYAKSNEISNPSAGCSVSASC